MSAILPLPAIVPALKAVQLRFPRTGYLHFCRCSFQSRSIYQAAAHYMPYKHVVKKQWHEGF